MVSKSASLRLPRRRQIWSSRAGFLFDWIAGDCSFPKRCRLARRHRIVQGPYLRLHPDKQCRHEGFIGVFELGQTHAPGNVYSWKSMVLSRNSKQASKNAEIAA